MTASKARLGSVAHVVIFSGVDGHVEMTADRWTVHYGDTVGGAIAEAVRFAERETNGKPGMVAVISLTSWSGNTNIARFVGTAEGHGSTYAVNGNY